MNTDQSKGQILGNWGLAIPQETIRAGSCKATKLEMSCRSMHNTLNSNRFFYCNISDKFYHIKILGSLTRPANLCNCKYTP